MIHTTEIYPTYEKQTTPGAANLEHIKSETHHSLDRLKQETSLSSADKQAIQKLPDYTQDATPDEQKVREKYFVKLKNDLLSHITLQEKDKDGLTALDHALRNFPGGNSFERLLSYLTKKNATKHDPITCSAIDIEIWSQRPQASSYLMQQRDDYFHILESLNHPSRKTLKVKKEERDSFIQAYSSLPRKPKQRAKQPKKDLQHEKKLPHLTASSPSKQDNRFDIDTTKSLGKERSKSGVTLCSRTAWRNMSEVLGLTPPPPGAGSALETMLSPEYYSYKPLVGSLFTSHYQAQRSQDIPPHTQRVDCHSNQEIAEKLQYEKFTQPANCGEIYLSSKKHPNYGHRAALYKGKDKQRYVLDPYVGGGGQEPQLLSLYLEKCRKDVYRINLFQSQL